MPNIEAIVAISDLHVGSTVAIAPPGFVMARGNTLGLNDIQEWFWQAWLRFSDDLERALDGRAFALVINGDLTEANHHKTQEIWSVNEADHVGAAIKLLKPLAAKAAKVFVVEGTECHTRDFEHEIALHLGAVEDVESGRPAFPRLSLTANNIRCVFHHHMPTTSRAYLESNALGIMLGNEQLNAARAGEPIPRVLGMAHRHVAGAVESPAGIAFCTPAWQALTRYGYKAVPQSRVSTGAVMVDLTDNGPKLTQFTYRPPRSQGVTL